MSMAKISPSAMAISATIKHFSLSHTPHQTFLTTRIPTSVISRQPRNPTVTICSKASEPLEVCAKESSTSPNKLGDCPLTQRVLLTLEEKHLSYDLKLVDLSNKPEWFLNISPEGKVPLIKLDENWIPDTDVMTQTLEEKFPEPSLATLPEKAAIGSKIFSTFIGFLKSKDSSDGTEQALLDQLVALNSYLEKNTIFSRDSFTKTRAQLQDVIEGWRPKVEG